MQSPLRFLETRLAVYGCLSPGISQPESTLFFSKVILLILKTSFENVLSNRNTVNLAGDRKKGKAVCVFVLQKNFWEPLSHMQHFMQAGLLDEFSF